MKNDYIILRKAFPSYLSQDIDLIYKNILQHLDLIYEGIPLSSYWNNIDTFNVLVNNEKLEIPTRIHLTESNHGASTATQKCILDCYYTRHGDGFIREKYLKRIITNNQEWVPPFVIQLLGEYVIEILEVIFNELDRFDLSLYRNFIENNMDFYNLTKQRVVSYWNCYYRQRYNKCDYVGFKVLDYIDTKIMKG